MKFMRCKKIIGDAVSLIRGCTGVSSENEEPDSTEDYIKSGFKKLEYSDDVWYKTDETSGYMVIKGSGSIPFQAFAERNDIIALEISGGFSYIDDGAFEKCRNLKEVKIESAGIIKDRAFSQCTGLRKVYVSSAGCIYPNAFSRCVNLKSFTAEKIENISYDAFKGCSDLREVTICTETPPTVSEEAFDHPYPDIVIPGVSLEEYIDKLGEEFSIKGYEYETEEEPADKLSEEKTEISFIKIKIGGSFRFSDYKERIPV